MMRLYLLNCVVTVAVTMAGFTANAWAQAPDVGSEAPLLYCELQTVTSCDKDKQCKKEDNYEGVKLPLNITVDIPSSVVAFTEADGWVYTSKISSAAENQKLIMLYGMGRLLSWQMQILKKASTSEEDRLMMALQIGTADAAAIGYGECEIEDETEE
jgi:hypothetical protein